MTANEAIDLPPQEFVRLVNSSSEVYDEKLPCHPFHLGGGPKSDDGAELFLKVKQQLPRVDFNPIVGWTGYIIWPDDLPTSSGWTLDEVGRLVGYVGNIRFFQRYVNRCSIVISIDGSYFGAPSPEDMKLLDEALQ